jgi:Iap family predicted aminopeptidase
MYVKITNGSVDTYPYSIGQLRRDNPNTSFPKKIPEAIMAAYGMYPITIADEPTYDSSTHKIQQAETPTLVDGVWTITSSAVALTAEEIQAATDAKAAAVRKLRDALLAETDWTGLSDVTMSAEMAAYRQALRDITTHANFPNLAEEDYPVKPE